MVLLKANARSKDFKFLGAQLPFDLHSFLILYCTAHGYNKSDIVKDLLEGWREETESKYPLSILYGLLVDRIVGEWERLKRKGTHYSYEVYKTTVYNELLGKGIKEEWIDEILEKL